jgi:hypothetical protein
MSRSTAAPRIRVHDAPMQQDPGRLGVKEALVARSGTYRKRVLGIVVLAVVAVVIGIATSVVAAVAAPDRISLLWVSATVADDGSAQIEEVVDYDLAAPTGTASSATSPACGPPPRSR